MTENGFIKLHRQFLDWEWIENANVVSLFVICLLKANHKDNSWQGVKIPRGAFITSYDKLRKLSGLSMQQLRTALEKLKSTQEISLETTRKYSIITVNNYEKYQAVDDVAVKETFQKPNLTEIKQYCSENQKNVDAETFFNFYESKNWKVGKNKMQNWKAAVCTWDRKNKQNAPQSHIAPVYSSEIED